MNLRVFLVAALLLFPLAFAQDAAPNTPLLRMVKWEFKTNDFIDSSPDIGEGKVFIGSADGKLYAFDAATGLVKWRFTSGGAIESSPSYYNGMVYFGSNDNATYAVNASNGTLAWQYNTSGKAYSSPAIASGVVLIGSADGSLYALDAMSGTYRWSHETGRSIYSSPTVSAGIIYVGSNDAKFYALNASNGEKVWEFETGGPIYSSPKIMNNVAYFGSYDGRVYAVDAFNGSKLWSFTTNDKVLSSPAAERGVVWIGSTDGHLYALNAFTGEQLWAFNANASIESSPHFSARNNAVYFGANNNKAYALNALTGALLWSLGTGNWVTSSPTSQGSLVYFGSYDRRIYAVSTISSVFFYPESGQTVNGSTLTMRGSSFADAGVKMVELQLGTDPEWHVATGTTNWTYTWGIANLQDGGYRIRVRTTDNNDQLEMEPFRQLSVIVRQQNQTFYKPMVIDFPARLKQGDLIRIAVTDEEGNMVPFVRVDMDGASYYDDNGDGVVDTDQQGSPLVVNKSEGEITFTVTKEDYYVQPGVRLAITLYSEDYTPYIAGGAVVIILILGIYIWKKRREPGYV